MADRSEHRATAWGEPAKAVARGIDSTAVRLRLDDATDQQQRLAVVDHAADQELAEQRARHGQHWPLIEAG